MDFGYLLGGQGVQLPDPVRQAQAMMSLAQVANQNKLAQYTLAAAQRKDAAATGVGQALGGLDINDDAAVQQAIQRADPEARQGILDAVLAARKSAATSKKDTAEADKNSMQTKQLQNAVAGGLAQTLLSKGQAVTQQDVAAANANAARYGLPPGMFDPPDPTNPFSHWQSIAGAATTAQQQMEQQGQAATRAETATHNRATEGNQAATLAQTTARDSATAAYQRGELANSNLRARAAVVTADPYGVSGLNTGPGGTAAPAAPSYAPSAGAPTPTQAPSSNIIDPATQAARNGQAYDLLQQERSQAANIQEAAAIDREIQTRFPNGRPAMQGGPQATGPAPGAAMAAMQAGLHGDAFLQTLPAPLQARVKALAEGREAPPTGGGARSPQMQQLLTFTNQYDPTFDEVNWRARNTTRTAFASGKDAAITASLNQLAGHIDRFENSSAALNNSSYPMYNAAANAVGHQFSPDTDARLTRWNTDRQAVIAEAERVFSGTGGSEGDRNRWLQSFNNAASPEALHSALDELVHLVGSRIDAQVQKYNDGMSTTATTLPQLTPAAAATYKRFGINVSAAGGDTPSGSAPAAPTQDKSKLLMEARDAISKGAPAAKVKARLQELGVTESP